MSDKKEFPFPAPKDLNGKLLYHAEFIPFKWKQMLDLHEKCAKEYLEKARTETSPALKAFYLKWAEEHERGLARMKEKTPMMNMDARRAQKAMEEMR